MGLDDSNSVTTTSKWKHKLRRRKLAKKAARLKARQAAKLAAKLTAAAVAGAEQDCGLSRVAASRILGGTDAGYGQFPWTALIQIYSAKHGLDKMCAGALVSPQFVLTAGHCVHYCREELLPNCTDPVPIQDISFKVKQQHTMGHQCLQ